MTPSQLKKKVESSGHESQFFTRDTMRFFGDTMKNYGVRPATIQTHWRLDGTYSETPVDRDVWELYRKRLVKGGLKTSTYFCMITFKRIFTA